LPLSRLNKEQLEAATCKYGHNLIIASAGTGKTSTIVARIAHLINNGVKPEEILLLTFTNKSAHEMVTRVAKYFGDEAKKVEAGTFHAVSYRLLKRFGKNISLKQPSELKILFKSIYERRNFLLIDPESRPYSATYLYDEYSLFLNATKNQKFDDWLLNTKGKEEHEIYMDAYVDIINEYEELKRDYGYVNFDDLLVMMRDELSQRELPYKEVLVDEYQDTNPLQNSLIEAIEPNSLFCVGDYDQSIYAFNGSDISIIGSFSDRYPKSNVYTLTKNYRSTQYILTLANRVIEINDRLYPKRLEVIRDSKEAHIPSLLMYDELFSQYHAISKKISQSHRKHSEIAIIFRNNSSADGIEASLREYDIVAKRRGGTSFFDTREIKAILDLATLFSNPKDMMAFIHIFEYARGIGSAIAKELFEALYELGDGNIIKGFLHPKDVANPFKKRNKALQLGLFDDFEELGSVSQFRELNIEEGFLKNPILKHPKLSIDGARLLYEYYILLKKTRQVKSPTTLISILQTSDIFGEIIHDLSTKRATTKEGNIDKDLKEIAVEKINRKIELLKDLTKHYNDLDKFLNAMVLGSKEITEKGGVNLLSVHASKGLEFEEVYVVDLMDGRFPNRKLMSKSNSDIDEERRLFYVAVTRAKDELYLSYARYDKIKKIDYIPSLFLKEAGMVE
jgi:DNA helicase-2/ATP-dependent DNA helicase PcrA